MHNPRHNRLFLAMAAAVAAPPTPTIAARNGNVPAIKPLMVLRPNADAAGEYELLIYGDIGESWWGESVTALSIVQQLQALPAGTTQINVRINSYGGSVSDGIAIYNALKRNTARKVVTVDGVAMSSASLIAMVGDEVSMPATSLLMIHAPWGLAQGNAQDMRVMADVLDTYADAMANAYAAKSGKPKADMRALLDDGIDHYYTGEQAVAAGFADAVIDALDDTDGADDEAAAQARAVGVQRFGARAPQHIAQMAIAAAARHPVPLAAPAPEGHPRNGTMHVTIDARQARAMVDEAVASVRAELNPPPARQAADTPAASQPGDTTMPQVNNTAPQADTPAVDAAAIRSEAHAALRARNEEIKAVLEPYMQRKGVNALYVAALADPDATADSVRAKALDLIGRESEPAGGAATAGETQAEKTFAGMTAALEIRAGLRKADGANPFRGHSLREMARACVEASGKNTRNMDVREVVAAAFTSTSDFPLLLSNTAQSALLRGYEEAPETFPLFTRPGTLSDFKEVSRAGLGAFSNLDEVPEGGEYKYGTFGENGAKVKLATYGKLFAITRQAVINDDLGAFTLVPQKMGRAAKRTIGNLVFSVLTTNANMADGYALFESTHHKNLLTAAAISTASVDAMGAAMATQKGPDGQVLNMGLRYLIVPRTLLGAANVVLNSEYEVGASTRNNTTPNSVRGTFEVITDARLDANSTTGWYGSADPNVADTIEVSYLDGQQAPYLEQKNGWDVDGTEFKVRIDAGVKALDYRGLAKNAGA